MINKKQAKKGFTIVELVIVIAVIAILAAVLIPTFTGVVKDAKESAALADAKNAYTSYIAEAAEDGEYETDVVIAVKASDTETIYYEVTGGALNVTPLSEKETDFSGYKILWSDTKDTGGKYTANNANVVIYEESVTSTTQTQGNSGTGSEGGTE